MLLVRFSLSLSHQSLSYIGTVFREGIPEGNRQLKDKDGPKMNQTSFVLDNITYCWNENLKKYTFWCDDTIEYFDDEIDVRYQVAPGNAHISFLLNLKY